MTKVQKVLSAKKAVKPGKPAGPTVIDQISAIEDKFTQLEDVRKKIAANKVLFQQQEQLLSELLPLFITKTDGTFVIQREITIGNKKHKLSPYFYDEKKGTLQSKVWKSTAFETAAIE